jgi:short-subunit dehydrogenase
MNLDGTRVLLTGAAGGIGSALAVKLAEKGANLSLVARHESDLEKLINRIEHKNITIQSLSADLADPEQAAQTVNETRQKLGGIDLLINCAGLMSFRPLSEEDPAVLQDIIQLNLVAPMLLARYATPEMLARGTGRIVNVGSTFGSIGFAWFAAYSASKFGLRGLSEAFRRELDGSGVGVTYVAPRAVKTRLNAGAIYQMAEATHMRMDEPDWVAEEIVSAIERDAKDVYLGFPEKLFARLNSILPRWVDAGLRKQNQVMETFARAT